jgi:prepilin signal peptidase PulO-like enzyme (type II secretory pathway)
MIVVMIIAGLFIFGLCVGSFVNALTWRLRNKRNWVNERSECTHCRHQLAPKDLIPVISWLTLRGKCRYCHKPIEDSPWVELLTGVSFAASYAFWPYNFDMLGVLLFVTWLLALIIMFALLTYDYKWMLLPNKLIWPLLVLASLHAIVKLANDSTSLTGIMSSILVSAGLFYALFQLSKGKWIGGGDVKLGLGIGLLLTSPTISLLMLFIASSLGSLTAVPALVRGKAKAKMKLPFGPFLIIATIIVYLFGPNLLTWYQNLLYI